MKRLAKDTAIYGLSSIVGRVLNWMLVPVYTRVLESPAEYGIVTNIYGYTALFLVVLTYGMETGFFRFVNGKEEKAPALVYGSALYSVACTSLLFIAGVWFFLSPLSAAAGYEARPEYLGMMACIVAVDAFCCLPFAWLRYADRPLRFATVKLMSILANILLNIFFLIGCPAISAFRPELTGWFYRPDYGVGYILAANLFATALTFAVLLPEIVPGFRAGFDLRRLRMMLRYSFPILLLGIAGILNQTVDKILFPLLFDDVACARAQLGIYGACFKIAVVMVMFTQAFRYAYEPFVFAKNKAGDNRDACAAATKYFIFFSLLIFLAVMFYLDMLKYFVDGRYFSGLSVVPIVMLGELFFGVYYNLSVWYKLTDRTHWGAWFSAAGCLLTIAVILGFAPRYGFIACAWASFASNLLMMLLSYFIGQRRYPVRYDLRAVFTAAAVAAACYAAGMMPPIASVALRLAYRTLILALFAAIIIRKYLLQTPADRPQ